MTIQVLPESLANQIAAGEVVERPASVVKELLENAIDAGSTRIAVEIEAAGKERISVSDNGSGMSAQDARLAFERHATSKIGKPDDLADIQTLGFRGEALPSIGSIARVTLTTTDREGAAGTEVRVEGGADPVFKETACPRGTTVEVRQLFYNTPARQKFLKRDATEASYITQVVQQQALAHPGIHFSLHHNGRKVINTVPTEQILYRIADLFGADLTRELLRVEKRDGTYELEGYISSPVLTRSKRDDQYCFVNQRYIRDKVLLSATQQGYSHLLPRGQHAVLFLFFKMAPSLLDVNVHPAKAEVRFAFQSDVYRFVSSAVRDALVVNEKSLGVNRPQGETEWPQDSLPQAGGGNPTYAPKWSSQAPQASPAPGGDAMQTLRPGLEALYGNHGDPTPAAPHREWPREIHLFNQKPSPVSDLIYSEFEPLGQLNQSFIIMQGRPGILVVDQHIAHERVLYERFRDAAQNKKVEIQTLLFPITLEFPPAEAQVLETHLEELKKMGLEMEAFGNNGFLLRTVPAILKNHDHENLVRDIVAELNREDKNATLQNRYEEVMIMMACRNAITVNHPMELDQIRKLIHDLEQTEMPYTCPHGRPIALLFEMDGILKKFHRK